MSEVANPQEYREKLVSNIRRHEIMDQVARTIETVRKATTHKHITRRFVDKVEAALPDFTVSYGRAYSFADPTITVWNEEIGYSNRFSFYCDSWQHLDDTIANIKLDTNPEGAKSYYQAKYELEKFDAIVKDLDTLRQTIFQFVEKYTIPDQFVKLGPNARRFDFKISYSLRELLKNIVE